MEPKVQDEKEVRIIQDEVDFGISCPHGYPYGICSRCGLEKNEPKVLVEIV